MAYGNGDKTLLRKALPVGSANIDTISLPAGKLSDLSLLRQRYMSVANDFVDAVFTKEPLKGTMAAKIMESVLIDKQKQVVGLNKAYAEKARLSIPSIIHNVEKIYLGRIFGRLALFAHRRFRPRKALSQAVNPLVNISTSQMRYRIRFL
jgi:hypothetical protein